MRLLFVSHSFPPAGRPLANLGGMQRVATELHAALAEKADLELDELLLRTTWKWTHLKTIPFLVHVYREIKRKAEAAEVDVVLFSSMVTATTAIPLRRLLHEQGIRTAAIVHGRDVTLPVMPYQKWLVPAVFRSLDAVLPVSRATGKQCLDRGLPQEKLHVVPNGIDVTRFEPAPDRSAARARVIDLLEKPVPKDAFLLASVGRQVERKGFAWFAEEVMPTLPQNAIYLLAGDGPQAEAIDEAAGRAGMSERVLRLGRVSEEELRTLYRGADLFVMPNIPVPGDMEGFGVVMLEAGLSGTPAVAARLEGIQDVITDDQNGFLVPSGDVESYREVIQRYMDDEEALVTLSRRAARHTRETFSWTAVADQYLATLGEITAVSVAEAA